MTEDIKQFIETRQEKFGGMITWRGFSLFYGDTEGNIREKGGLVMKVGDVFHFEDFEVKSTFLGIPIESKKESNYVKLETSFDAKDVTECMVVTKHNALDFLHSRKPLVEVNKFIGFFAELVIAVKLKGSRVMFFQLGDDTNFVKMLNEYKNKE